MIGAAILGGLIGMADEIRRKRHLTACPLCGVAASIRVYPRYNEPHPVPFSWCCMPCLNAHATPSPSQDPTDE